MQHYVHELLNVVEHATPALLALSDADSKEHAAPGKWSPREVIGHLIDSASNNHQRFVRARFQNDLVRFGALSDCEGRDSPIDGRFWMRAPIGLSARSIGRSVD